MYIYIYINIYIYISHDIPVNTSHELLISSASPVAKRVGEAAATPVDPAEDGFLDGIGVRLRR